MRGRVNTIVITIAGKLEEVRINIKDIKVKVKIIVFK